MVSKNNQVSVAADVKAAVLTSNQNAFILSHHYPGDTWMSFFVSSFPHHTMIHIF